MFVIMSAMAASTAEKTGLQIVSTSSVEKRIYVIRGRQVMLDEDLAELYGVETKRLIEQVKRISNASPATSCSGSAKTSPWL